MSTIMVRRLSDDDVAWLKQQAEDAGMMMETWIRHHIKNRSIGQLPSPAAVTLVPSGPLIPTRQPDPTVEPQSLPIEDVLREADLEDSPRSKVAALQHMYDGLFPPDGRYKYARLSESRAKEWLRCCGGSAIEVYDVLMDRVWNRVDDEGNYCDYRGKLFDNPATYASAVLKKYVPAEESSPATYGHLAPLKEFDPFPLEERGLCYESSSTAARKQGAIGDQDWAIIRELSKKAGYPVGEAS